MSFTLGFVGMDTWKHVRSICLPLHVYDQAMTMMITMMMMMMMTMTMTMTMTCMAKVGVELRVTQ